MALRTAFLFFALFLVSLSLSQAQPQAPEVKLPVDYLFQFGDSISDTGNLVIESPLRARNYANLPYGITMNQPTGRLSDGLLMIDHFTTFFNMPYLNPYLVTSLIEHDTVPYFDIKALDFSHGVNFAVGGSTALNFNTLQYDMGVFSAMTRNSLSLQLDWFRAHLDTFCDTALECREKLSRSLVLIETGSEDYNYAMSASKTMDQVHDMVPQVVDAIINATKQVISYGATRVYIPGIFPIGCLPVHKSRSTHDNLDDLGCLEEPNALATLHNEYLKKEIKELQEEYPEATLVYGDYYSAMSSVLKNAEALGFDVANKFKACCGVADKEYNFDMSRMCGSLETQVCAEPKRFVSWDGIHMTEQANYRMSQWLLPRLVRDLNINV